ncbi:hypothetical protein BJX96DRAFT_145539 [Aspergillus floccosus]
MSTPDFFLLLVNALRALTYMPGVCLCLGLHDAKIVGEISIPMAAQHTTGSLSKKYTTITERLVVEQQSASRGSKVSDDFIQLASQLPWPVLSTSMLSSLLSIPSRRDTAELLRSG